MSVTGPIVLLLSSVAGGEDGPWVLPPNEALPAIRSERPVVLPKGWLEAELALAPGAPAGVLRGRWGVARGLELGVEGGYAGGEGPTGPALGLRLAPLRGEAPLRGLAVGIWGRAPGAAGSGPLGSALDTGAGAWEGGAGLEGVLGIGALRLDLALDGALRGRTADGAQAGHRARVHFGPELQVGPLYLHGGGSFAALGPAPGSADADAQTGPDPGADPTMIEGGWSLQLGAGLGLNLSRGVELRVDAWPEGWSGAWSEAAAGPETKKIEAPRSGLIVSFSGRLSPRRLGLRDGPAPPSP